LGIQLDHQTEKVGEGLVIQYAVHRELLGE